MKTFNEYFENADQQIEHAILNRPRKVKNKAAKDFLHANMDQLPSEDFKRAVIILVGRRDNKQWMVDIITALTEKGQLPDIDIFRQFKKGEYEMRKVIKHALSLGTKIEKIGDDYIVTDYV